MDACLLVGVQLDLGLVDGEDRARVNVRPYLATVVLDVRSHLIPPFSSLLSML